MMKIKLSDAIRRGAKLHPQGFRAYVEFELVHGTVTITETCALGAALVGLYGEAWANRHRDNVRFYEYENEFIVSPIHVLCPVEDCGSAHATQSYSVPDTVIHLNDGHEWTREQIADWIDTLPMTDEQEEPEKEPEPLPVPVKEDDEPIPA